MKPRAPTSVSIIAIAFHASVWAYPVVDGGLGNVAGFIAWGLINVVAICGVLSLFVEAKPSKYRRQSLPTRILIRVSAIGGMAWLVWHGEFVLAGLWVLCFVLTSIYRIREEAADREIEEAA